MYKPVMMIIFSIFLSIFVIFVQTSPFIRDEQGKLIDLNKEPSPTEPATNTESLVELPQHDTLSSKHQYRVIHSDRYKFVRGRRQILIPVSMI